MASVQIPGIGEPSITTAEPEEIILPVEEQKTSYRVVVDVDRQAISIVSLRIGEIIDDHRYIEIQPLPEDHYQRMGVRVEEIDYDENLDIHCDICDTFYRPFCREHPLFSIPDKNYLPSPILTRARGTMPPLFDIKKSKIPNAGLGVFAKMLIPIGFVFGPYAGARRETDTEIKVDGYAWEINDKESEKKIFIFPLKSFQKNFYVDGADENESNWLRFINSPRGEEEQKFVGFFNSTEKVYYRVIMPIKAKDELLVWYGANFGHKLLKAVHKTSNVKKAKNPFIY
ncbi:unnamed protein product [Caenorhabditis auriculariae]|uniref:SET domain-containing protein n=1 Tax=Caenorhabditis auriculariae TaxID=2777116 RepID=A0A8S1GQT0_9PELO|nr:unnamed protein product [Caenorhabditis auriculariae]